MKIYARKTFDAGATGKLARRGIPVPFETLLCSRICGWRVRDMQEGQQMRVAASAAASSSARLGLRECVNEKPRLAAVK